MTDIVGSLNLPFVEDTYAIWLRDPAAVGPEWRRFFEQMGDGSTAAGWTPPGRVVGPGVPAQADRRPPVDGPAKLGQLGGASLPAAPVADMSSEDSPELREAVEFLRRLSLFRRMPNQELSMVARVARPVHFEAGTTICHEGELGSAAYIITRGRVAVQRNNRVLTELGVGEVVGELSVIDNQPRSADVIAEGPVEVLEIRADDFQKLLDSRTGLARGLLQVLTSRVRDTSFRQAKVDMLVRAFRVRGHVQASVDPLHRDVRRHPELTLEHYDLTEGDLDKHFAVQIGEEYAVRPLRETVETLRAIYCGAIGAQYMHIDDLEVQDWIRRRLENVGERRRLRRDEQLRILRKLTDAEIFEQFLHRKFVGAKRFSLEGAESLIPLLDYAIEEAGGYGVDEVVIGMAHRGRLNVLANVLNKPASQIFREFRDVDPERYAGRGDVKYHLGHSSDRLTASGQKVHLSLCFNPSHLGFVGPVVLGRVRAKQDRRGDVERGKVMPLLIHGDAAFTGQGLTQELFNLSELAGYTTGGCVHVIVNNQIGFTTLPEEGRSSPYATDVARMLQIPVFHVNGEQPDAVTRAIRMAMDFRFAFRRDVVIDMYCYRKYGHNEGDDPTFTQPRMYAAIGKKKTVLESFTDNLLAFGEVTRAESRAVAAESKQALETDLESSRQPEFAFGQVSAGAGLWTPYRGGPDAETPLVATRVPAERLKELLVKLTELPPGFEPNRKIGRFLKNRRDMANGERPLDWGAAEALAFATLVEEGTRLRLCGQDAQRGTFSHRHAAVHERNTGEVRIPLQHLSDTQAPFEVYNSPLTETGVVGFEWGFSLDYPDGLVLWEAQFGDFCNVAQVIIDQFITSSEDKWRRLSGLVMLLPHGFEGQGPEHSSARLERFLQLAAADNIQVVNLTTPAQLFHCLRRQVVRPWRKPLVVMSPKSLLRHPGVTSSLDELANGRFQRVIPEAEALDPAGVRKILLCSGKVYYDLLQFRKLSSVQDVALIRLAQYYPVPREPLREALAAYPTGTPVVWVQEEPTNMGAWGFLKWRLGEHVAGNGPHPLSCVSRPESASPATGSAASHALEQAALLKEAFS